MRTLLTAFLLVVSSSAADDKELSGDLKTLQGSWTAMVGPEKNVALVLTVKGADLTFHITTPEGEEFDLKGKAKLDEKAKPKTLDISGLTSPDGNDLAEVLAIYELDADDLKLCGGQPGKARPTEFKDDPENMVQVTVFKRKKDDK